MKSEKCHVCIEAIRKSPFKRLECQIEIGMKNARRNWKRSKKKGTTNVTDDDFKRIASTEWIPLDKVLAILELAKEVKQ